MTPPLARSVEKDWMSVQTGYAKQLYSLSRVQEITEHGLRIREIPVVVAGDYFDKPTPPPELVNWAIAHMPFVYGIPGQHDLVNHSYKDLKKTSFYTLVQAGKIKLLKPGEPVDIMGPTPIRLHGFPWSHMAVPLEKPCDIAIDIAVIHKYVWTKNTGYDGAPPEARLNRLTGSLRGYDVAVVGDNHSPFRSTQGRCLVYGCGGFLRRKSDERKHRPSVGLLRADGTITRHYLDVSRDKFLEPKDVEEVLDRIGVETFVEELLALGTAAVDFAGVVERLLERKKVPNPVKRMVQKAMEGKR